MTKVWARKIFKQSDKTAMKKNERIGLGLAAGMFSFLSAFTLTSIMLSSAAQMENQKAEDPVAERAPAAVKKSASSKNSFKSLSIRLDDDLVTANRKASLLKALSDVEIKAFIVEASQEIPAPQSYALGTWIKTFDVLLDNKAFQPSQAREVLAILDKQKKDSDLLGLLNSLTLRLKAKAGDLNSDLIKAELQFVEDKKIPRADRIRVLGVLTDTMVTAGLSPKVNDLKGLLESDIYEIRMHAVDWFRLTRAPLGERYQFINQALKSNPYQVRERAYRYLKSLDEKEFKLAYEKAAGAKNGVPCKTDRSEVTKKLCEEAAIRAQKVQE